MKFKNTEEVDGLLIHLFQSLLFLLLVAVFSLSLKRKFDPDEIEAIHTAWKISKGGVIYVDFFQHHHPFFYYCIAPIINLVGENVNTLLTLRAMMLGCFLGMLGISFHLSKKVFNSKYVSWLTVLLTCSMSMFTQKALEVRPDVFQVLFALLAIDLLFKFRLANKKLCLYASSFCMALSFLFLQKTLFIIAGVGLMQLYWIYEEKFKVKYLIQYWALFILSISPYFIWLVFTSQFENYFFWNWTLNINFEQTFSPFETIMDSFSYNHFVWICYLIGIGMCFKKKVIDVPVLSIFLLATLFLVKAPYRQYFLPFVPFMCMVAAYGIYSLMNYKQAITVVASIFAVPVVYYMLNVLVYPNSKQLEKIEWVLNQTSEQDTVYDGKVEFNIFRPDIDYFWFSLETGKGGLQTFQKLKPYEYNIYKSIEKHKPSIISDAFIDDLNHEVIKEHYKKSAKYDDLYIRE